MKLRKETKKGKTMENNKIQMKLKGFRQWLDGFEDDQEVGMAAHNNRCPIAAYLKSQSEAPMYGEEPFAYVTPLLYVTGKREIHRRLPEWARRFVKYIDSGGARTVTAREARAILDQLENKGN
jgi:hypothetical protein